MPLWLRENLSIREQISPSCAFRSKYSLQSITNHMPPAHSFRPLFENGYPDHRRCRGVSHKQLRLRPTQQNSSIGGNALPIPLEPAVFCFHYYTGFCVNSGEYKITGLAPYSEPRYTGKILDQLVDLREHGSLRLNMKYFNYCHSLT
jgi:hypothetical protein